MTHLAAALVKDDFNVENRSELLVREKDEARKNNKTLIMPSTQTKLKAEDAYSEHRPQVGVSKSKRYVGHVKTLWLRFGISWCGRGCRGAGG